MARFALQFMAAPEAGAALREALPELDGDLKIGVIGPRRWQVLKCLQASSPRVTMPT